MRARSRLGHIAVIGELPVMDEPKLPLYFIGGIPSPEVEFDPVQGCGGSLASSVHGASVEVDNACSHRTELRL